jgi:hypothetical protein
MDLFERGKILLTGVRPAGDRRSRPHARHGLHPRHRTHLHQAAGHAPDAALLGDHAAGSRSSPSSSCTTPNISKSPGHHRRVDHHPHRPAQGPVADREAKRAACCGADAAEPTSTTRSSSATARRRCAICQVAEAHGFSPAKSTATWTSQCASPSWTVQGRHDQHPVAQRRRRARAGHQGRQPRLQLRRALAPDDYVHRIGRTGRAGAARTSRLKIEAIPMTVFDAEPDRAPRAERAPRAAKRIAQCREADRLVMTSGTARSPASWAFRRCNPPRNGEGDHPRSGWWRGTRGDHSAGVTRPWQTSTMRATATSISSSTTFAGTRRVAIRCDRK